MSLSCCCHRPHHSSRYSRNRSYFRCLVLDSITKLLLLGSHHELYLRREIGDISGMSPWCRKLLR